VVAFAILIVSGFSESAGYERDAANRSYANARNAERQIAADCGPGVTFNPPQCVKEAKQAARAEQREEQDLAAQKVTAWWTGLMGAAAIFGAVLSALGVFLVYRTFRASHESNEIARDTAKRQLRAYMGINKYDVTPYQLEEPGSGRFKIAMANFGQTPAIALSTVVSYAVTDWVDMQTRPNDWDFVGARLPIDVPPSAPMFRDISFAEHAVGHSFELQSGASVLWIRFQAEYADIYGRQHEQTTLFCSRHSNYRSGTMVVVDQTRETTTEPKAKA
jgi:hypothetical protein